MVVTKTFRPSFLATLRHVGCLDISTLCSGHLLVSRFCYCWTRVVITEVQKYDYEQNVIILKRNSLKMTPR